MDLFKAESQEEFILLAYKYYYNKREYLNYDGSNWSPKINIIQWLYDLGRDYQILNMSFDEFDRVMQDKQRGYNNGKQRHNPRTRRVNQHYIRRWCWGFDEGWHRVLRGFHYTGQSKKIIDNVWRNYKQIARDKAKYNNFYNGRSWKKSFRKSCARRNRSLERRCLYNGDYESLHRLTYKQADNPWSWN